MANRMVGIAVGTFSEPAASVFWLTDGVAPGVALARAVFDTAHIAVDPETGAPVSSVNPVMGVLLSDLPSKPTNRDFVMARGVLYRVSNVQPDGVAGVTLFLKKA